MLFVQKLGRWQRTAPGKDHLVTLDHAGNHLRLGMVNDAILLSIQACRRIRPTKIPATRPTRPAARQHQGQ
jgi:hypothetical protein